MNEKEKNSGNVESTLKATMNADGSVSVSFNPKKSMKKKKKMKKWVEIMFN